MVRLFFLVIALGFAGGSSMAAGSRMVLDGTAARVGEAIITIHQAYAYRAINGFFEGAADPLLLESGDILRRTVQKIVFENMVMGEIRSLQFEASRATQTVKALQAQLDRGKNRREIWRKILQRHKLSEEAALKVYAQTLQVDGFLKKKVETLTPVITQNEVERYYEQNKAKLQPSELEALRPNIIILLKKEKTQKGLEEWVRGLKSKYRVVNLLAT